MIWFRPFVISSLVSLLALSLDAQAGQASPDGSAGAKTSHTMKKATMERGRSRLALATLLCLLSVGCHSSASSGLSEGKTTILHALSSGPESLTGQYGVVDKGKTVPFIRISHPDSSGPFVIEEFADNKWKVDKETGRPLTREEFKQLVGAGIDVPFTGLVLGQTAFIKVPEGWQQGKFKTKTGYLFFSLFGPMELTRNVGCGSGVYLC